MKIAFLRMLCVILPGFLGAGCASTGYLAARGRDAADVVTLTVGTGTGVKARVGPVMLAAVENADLVGLRAGQWLWDGNGLILNDEMYLPIPIESVLPLLKVPRPRWQQVHRPPEAQAEKPDLPAWQRKPSKWSRLCGEEGFSHGITSVSDARKKYVIARSPFPLVAVGKHAPFYTQIEGVAGFIFSVRVGINIGELLDFALGWAGVDIYGDDVD